MTIKNVSVFNMMGQQVINANTANEVDLSTLTNGNYVVRIELSPTSRSATPEPKARLLCESTAW